MTKNTTYKIGKPELKVLEFLAANKKVTRNQIATGLKNDLTNTIKTVKDLEKKNLVKTTGFTLVKGSQRPIYSLTEDAITFLIANDIKPVDEILTTYPESEISRAYKTTIILFGNKNLAKKIVKQCTKSALSLDDPQAAIKSPDMLIEMSALTTAFYNNLPQDEVLAIYHAKGKLEENPQTKAAINRSKDLLKKRLTGGENFG